MKVFRYPLSGPHPPATVVEIRTGPGFWGPEPYPPLTMQYLRHDVGNIWRKKRLCAEQGCDYEYCYHWFNGDRTRTWSSLPNRAVYPEALDCSEYSRMHQHTASRYRARRRRKR